MSDRGGTPARHQRPAGVHLLEADAVTIVQLEPLEPCAAGMCDTAAFC